MDDPKTLSSNSTSFSESTLSAKPGEITEKNTKTNVCSAAMIFVKTRLVSVGNRRTQDRLDRSRIQRLQK